MRRAILWAALVGLVLSLNPVRADSQISVSSSQAYSGFDSSLAAGKWRLTTLGIEGDVLGVHFQVYTLDGTYVTGLGYHPRTGQTVQTWHVVPPGTYRVEMQVWRPNESKVGRATFALDTP